ncbi:proline racemase family protein [Streptomyces sp. NPDC002643]
MRAQHLFQCVDSHTAGNPTRTVLSGVPRLKGKTMLDKMRDLEQNHDWVRTSLMFEPRGHAVMSGCALVEPCDPSADVGVLYIEASGHLPMCGHDTIGLATVLVETGQVPVVEPETRLRFDTPAGLVDVVVEVSDGHAGLVRFLSPPSFLLHEGVEVRVPDRPPITVDIAYGGNFYAIADADALGLTITADDTAPAIALARRLLPAVNEAIDVRHPVHPEIAGVTHIQFTAHSDSPEADGRVLVIIRPAGADRSPCGTGTSARVAALVAQGRLPMGRPFTHQSITGGTFRARAVETAHAGEIPGVRVEIAGRAHLTATSTQLLDPEDPLRHGFLVT